MTNAAAAHPSGLRKLKRILNYRRRSSSSEFNLQVVALPGTQAEACTLNYLFQLHDDQRDVIMLWRLPLPLQYPGHYFLRGFTRP